MKTLPVIPSIARDLHVALLLLPLCAIDLAAQDTARIAPVVVSATRNEMSRTTLPVAVSVITGAELQLRGITTVAEALRDVTSAYVAQSGSQGAQTSLFLRGGESKYVKVLVDGVPANDPGGSYDFASLTTDNVERIEIVRGPVSVIHGADAVTGVVHVITKTGRGPSQSTIDIRTGMAPRPRIGPLDQGAMRTFDVSADAAGALASSRYSLGIARHESSGLYALNNHFNNNVLSGRVDLLPTPNSELRLSVRYSDYRYNYPTNGGGTVGDLNANRTEDRLQIGAELTRRMTATTRASLMLTAALNDGVTDDAMDSPSGTSTLIQDKTRRRGAELRVGFVPTAHVAGTVGLHVEQQDHRNTLQSLSTFGPFMSNFKAARQNTGLYGELVLLPVERVAATLGARLDRNEAFGTFGTYRAGLSAKATGTTRLRFTVGTAFREPTFLENYASGFVVGNPDLVPERTFSIDGGFDQQLPGDRGAISVTAFAQRFTEMIDFNPDFTAPTNYSNIAEATSNGIELDVRSRVTGALWAALGATFLATEVVDPGFDQTEAGLYRAGEPLIRRPEVKIRGELAYRGAGPVSATLAATHVGERHDKDFRPFPFTAVVLPAYTRVDLGAEYALPVASVRRAALTLRVENLTDEEYQNVFNFLAPRRTIALGVRAVM